MKIDAKDGHSYGFLMDGRAVGNGTEALGAFIALGLAQYPSVHVINGPDGGVRAVVFAVDDEYGSRIQALMEAEKLWGSPRKDGTKP
jgi:hypothetical protein